MSTFKFSKWAKIEVKVEVEAETLEEALDKIEADGITINNYAGNGGDNKLIGVDSYDNIEVGIELVDDHLDFGESDVLKE